MEISIIFPIFLILVVDLSLKQAEEFSEERSTRRGAGTIIADDLFSEQFLLDVFRYIAEYSMWFYTPESLSKDGSTLSTTLNTSIVIQTDMLRKISRIVQEEDPRLILTAAKAIVLRRGDKAITCTSGSGITVVLRVSTECADAICGEITITDESETDVPVRLVPGRVVFLPARLPSMIRAPPMGSNANQIYLIFSFQTDQSVGNSTLQLNDLEFPSLPWTGGNLDVSSHVTRRYKSKTGREILVLDAIFKEDDLDGLLNFVITKGTYELDTSESSSDNVQWITGYDVQSFVQSGIWAVSKRIADYVIDEDYYPYDVTCNLIRPFDHTLIHTDSAPEQREYTLLIYLNRDWKENFHGETTFYESDDMEPFVAVRPRFGRVVIFDGFIHHSAHPPSVEYLFAGRFTFAVKMVPKADAMRYLEEEELHAVEEKLGSLEHDSLTQYVVEEMEEKRRQELLDKL
eukprot:m.311443 g.311443  ORF g.311443 m.311443 type:complete len:460 (+) comp70249_c0_seq1:114-1493(+)